MNPVTLFDKKEHWKYRVRPIYFGDFSMNSRVTAVESDYNSPSSITYTESASGYIVKKSIGFAPGLGVTGQWNPISIATKYPELVRTFNMLGLAISAGSNVFFENYAKNKEDIKNLKLKKKSPLKQRL